MILRKQNVTDGRTTVYPPQTKFAGDIIFSELNSFMHMFNVSTLYRKSIKLFH